MEGFGSSASVWHILTDLHWIGLSVRLICDNGLWRYGNASAAPYSLVQAAKC